MFWRLLISPLNCPKRRLVQMQGGGDSSVLYLLGLLALGGDGEHLRLGLVGMMLSMLLLRFTGSGLE